MKEIYCRVGRTINTSITEILNNKSSSSSSDEEYTKK